MFRSVKQDRYWDEEVSTSSVGRTPGILKDLLNTCRTEYLKIVEKKTCVFENHGSDWKNTSARPVRPLETVITEAEVKEDLLQDIGEFLSSGSRKWYADRGFPYRQGCLLYGPPGTGKSSLTVAMAGYWELDVYVLNISGVDDSGLAALFFGLPSRCVVLLEDVDAISASKIREKNDEKSSNPADLGLHKKASLSGLLNVIDGVTSSEGRVLVMTTNHLENLDEALVRPGRIDQKIELGLTDREILVNHFRTVYEPLVNVTEIHSKRSTLSDDLVAQFVSRVPDLEFSPAEVMSFLLQNRQSPTMAVANVESRVAKTRKQKE